MLKHRSQEEIDGMKRGLPWVDRKAHPAKTCEQFDKPDMWSHAA